MPHCCEKCFDDRFLKMTILNKNIAGDCDFCGSHSVYINDCTELSDLFVPVADVYETLADFVPAAVFEDIRDTGRGRYFWDILNDDWNIFSQLLSSAEQQNLTIAILGTSDDNRDLPFTLDSFIGRSTEFSGADDAVKSEYIREWSEFEEDIIGYRRFFPTGLPTIENINDILRHLEHPISAGTILFRARKSMSPGYDCDKMGMPPKNKTVDGRANPVGIPYLYLTTDIETCIAETRPGKHGELSIAEFEASKDFHVLRIIAPFDISPFEIGDQLEQWLTYQHFLSIMGEKLAKVINESDAKLKYLPTQYLCEYFKNLGYAGIMYKSAQSAGQNIALFKDELVKCTRVSQIKVTEIKYTHSPLA